LIGDSDRGFVILSAIFGISEQWGREGREELVSNASRGRGRGLGVQECERILGNSTIRARMNGSEERGREDDKAKRGQPRGKSIQKAEQRAAQEGLVSRVCVCVCVCVCGG
jgi:hypothetical protein